MSVVFIADFFVDEIIGGGELNNEEFIKIVSENHSVKKIKSHLVTVSFLEGHKSSKFVIANFVNLKNNVKEYITQNLHYVIYEHDHKYLVNRNPAVFKDLVAPKNMIINYDFYKRAKAVLCQSAFHENIVRKNLELGNIINLSGNLWSLDSIEKMKAYSQEAKINKCSIMNSNIPHKNTADAIKYCILKKMEYELIDFCGYFDFLKKLSKNNILIFLPKTPETLSRIVVESRMMGMKIITNNLVGAATEEWFQFKGLELINIMLKKREEIPNKILGFFENAG